MDKNESKEFKCQTCGCIHDGSYGSGRFCSKSCSSRYSSSVNKDIKNKKISNSLKGRLVGVNANLDLSKRVRTCCICGCTFISRKPRKTCNSPECLHSIRSQTSYFNKISKEEMSKLRVKSYENGRIHSGGVTKWYEYNGIKVQGTYELRACIIFDKWVETGKIKKWEYTNDRIKYTWKSDGSSHYYLLDFKLYNNDESIMYIEVKGYVREHDKEKWEEAKNLGLNFQVWFLDRIIKEEELLKL